MKHFPVMLALLTATGLPPVLLASDTQALIVGIDAYPESPLPNCVKDAKDMRALLKHVPDGRAVLLLDAQATKGAILSTLRTFAERAKPTTETHFYFSGHGSQQLDRPGGEEADGIDETLCAYDSDILDDELAVALGAIQGKVYFISDSCFSGTVTKELYLPRVGDPEERFGAVLSRHVKFRPNPAISNARAALAKSRVETFVAERGRYTKDSGHDVGANVRLLASSSEDEPSNVNPADRNSPFTEAFLEGLRAASKPLTFGEIRDYTENAIKRGGYRVPQHPALFNVQRDETLPSLYQAQYANGVAPSHAGAPAAGAMELEAQRIVHDAVTGLVRRLDANRDQIQDWIADFGVASKNGAAFSLRVSLKPDAPSGLHLMVFNVGPTGNMTLLYPNNAELPRELRGGASVEIGKARPLSFTGPAGEESVIAFVTQYDALSGIDWVRLGETDQRFCSLDEKAMRRDDLLSTVLRVRRAKPKDIVLGPSRRPGEGLAFRTLTLSSND